MGLQNSSFFLPLRPYHACIHTVARIGLLWLLAALTSSVVASEGNPSRTGGKAPLIRVGLYVDNYPYSFRDDHGKMSGFSVDLLAAIEQNMGVQFERVGGPTAAIVQKFLQNDGVDVLLVFSETPERLKICDFTHPYLAMQGTIIIRKGTSDIASFADLKDKKVLVHHNSFGEEILLKNKLGNNIIYASTVEESLQRLNAGEGDAALATRLSAISMAHYFKLNNLKAVRGYIDGYLVRYCMAVHKGNAATCELLNEGLAILNVKSPNELSHYEELHQKWFGAIEPIGYSRLEVAIATAIGLGVALLIAFWAIYRLAGLRRRLAKQALDIKVSEERYRGVFESTLEGILVMRRSAKVQGDFEVEQANKAALKLLKLESYPAQVTRLSMIHPRGRDFGECISMALNPGRPALFEFELQSEPQSTWIHVSVARKDDQLLVVMADISETKAVEERLHKSQEQLRQTQKLEAIGTLASGIAHDFNNILTGIIGNAQLAQMDLPDNHPVQGHIAEIMNSSGRAKTLVNQILTFSRKADTKREIIRTTPLVREVLQFLRSASPASIEIRHREDNSEPEINADATQVYQVLTNICTNAIHAMKGKPGLLEVVEETTFIGPEVTAIHTELKEGYYVRIAIRDTGCGMTPQVQQRIFEPFFTTKKAGEGTGLGLSVVHGIMLKHGGAVTVYSKPEQGSLFHLYFPLVKGSRSQATEDRRTPLAMGMGESVLFLDDEETIVKTVGSMLKRLGYQAHAFSNANEALECLKASPNRFFVVITDLTMPKMSGLDFIKAVREISPTTPVILASGYVGEHDYDQAQAAGIKHIIHKPFTFHALSQMLVSCRRQTEKS